jgi:hypothetical protein
LRPFYSWFTNRLGNSRSRGNAALCLEIIGGVGAAKHFLTLLGKLSLFFNKLLTALLLCLGKLLLPSLLPMVMALICALTANNLYLTPDGVSAIKDV